MERKTKIHAEDGQFDLTITREFDLPVDLLFRAHTDAELFGEWMSHEYGTTKMIKLEAKKHGGWEFETRDMKGNKVFSANGVFHEFIQDKKIIRTFEMDPSSFQVQIEFIEFEALSDDTSKLTIHSIYRSVTLRDEMLKLPFSQGLNMAHNRLEEKLKKVK
jgi:uncharacterized protein YndB with AHSA1/START domain